MTVEFIRFVPDDADALVDFLTGEEWPFHAGVPQEAAIRERIAAGHYDDDDERTFWIVADGERAGLVRLQDLGDETPLFDLRVRAAHRGKGLGGEAVRWLVRHLFESRPELRRIEGTTRHDNLAMRAAFLRAGFAKEAHYREGWPGLDGKLYDAVGYGILRSDWEAGVVTPPVWES